jgi:hypothetical protein
MRIELFQRILQVEIPRLPSRYLVDRSVARLGGTLRGNARGTRR